MWFSIDIIATAHVTDTILYYDYDEYHIIVIVQVIIFCSMKLLIKCSLSLFFTLGLLRPNVEKSKSSGLRLNSFVFSKKLLSSLRDLNLLPVGPMMKTSYLPAEAPLFLWETFLCQPWGKVWKDIIKFCLKFLFLQDIPHQQIRGFC